MVVVWSDTAVVASIFVHLDKGCGPGPLPTDSKDKWLEDKVVEIQIRNQACFFDCVWLTDEQNSQEKG